MHRIETLDVDKIVDELKKKHVWNGNVDFEERRNMLLSIEIQQRNEKMRTFTLGLIQSFTLKLKALHRMSNNFNYETTHPLMFFSGRHSLIHWLDKEGVKVVTQFLEETKRRIKSSEIKSSTDYWQTVREKHKYNINDPQQQHIMSLWDQSITQLQEDLKSKREECLKRSSEMRFKHEWDNPNRGKYQRLGEIGQGGFGEVSKVQMIDGEILAVKNVHTTDRSMLENEIRKLCLARIFSNYVIEVIDYKYKQNELKILMPLMNGDLDVFVSRKKDLSKKDLSKFILQTSSAIYYINNAKIAHRDIKPGNIMWSLEKTEKAFKLADFGLAVKIPYLTNAGTLRYLPPEAYKNMDYSEGCDPWAFGVTLFEVLSGEKPAGLSFIQYVHEVELITKLKNIITGHITWTKPGIFKMLWHDVAKERQIGLETLMKRKGEIKDDDTPRFIYPVPVRLPPPHKTLQKSVTTNHQSSIDSRA